MNLKGNTVLITGGTSGIGYELARVLLAKGNRVIICGRSMDRLEQARARLGNVDIVACDLAASADREKLVEWIATHHPACNMVISNAAIVHKTGFLADANMLSKAEQEIQVNFFAPVVLTKLLIPLLARNRDVHFIYMTTGLVYAPKAAYPIYSATKAALHSFLQTLRVQVKNEPVKIVEVMMPVVDTPFHRGVVPRLAISPEKAVAEMLRSLDGGYRPEIRVGAVKLLHVLSRLAPRFAFKKINEL